jgi:hypothetical protein
LENIRIIFIDIDGTLTNNNGVITDYTKNVLKKATKTGFYVVICSGRSNNDLIEKSKLANASPITISSNGTLVFDYDNNIKIYESLIANNLLFKIWDFSLANNIDLTFNSTFDRFKSVNSSKDAKIISTLDGFDEPITQIVAESNSYKSINLLINFIEKFENLEHSMLISHNDKNNNTFYELDIYNKTNNKGNAIQILLKYLNISKNYSICFGDGENDISMFESCKYKVAMSNGNEQLKEMADFVTEFSNNENGVAKFIEKHLLN